MTCDKSNGKGDIFFKNICILRDFSTKVKYLDSRTIQGRLFGPLLVTITPLLLTNREEEEY